MTFDLFGQIAQELKEFSQDKVHIAGSATSDDAKYLSRKSTGYDFSQWETLNLVELYYNSKFESGTTDAEGQRKVFLNIGQFRADVASKQVDLDVKDFVFVPELGASEWPAFFLNKKFRVWAKENGFGQLINDCVADYPKYGSVVVKKVGSQMERVPLMTLRNPHDAKSLKTARFVIEEHKDMTLDEIKAMKAWNTEKLGLKYGDKATVYERYGTIPLAFYKQYKGETATEKDYEETVDCMAIVTLDGKKDTSKNYTGNILFLEKITDRPYEEAHWKRQDGRWLGIGEIENQFENQVMRNMTANMRRRGLLWSSKKIFQSRDSEVAKNLVRDVKDGDVLNIGANGEIQQVNMNTQNLAEFQTTEDVWEKNSDQKSFTFEVATGEALPSGTPFRLGVVLSNAVNSHFSLKRENLGLFFDRLIMNQVFKVFQKENRKEHNMVMFADDEGIELLTQELVRVQTSLIARDQLLKGIIPDLETIKVKIEEQLAQRRLFEMKMPEGFYDDIKVAVTLVSTGENVNIEKRIETLTNLRNSLAQEGNLEAAGHVLKKILALTGENFDFLAGKQQQGMQQQMAMAGQAPQGMPTPAQAI